MKATIYDTKGNKKGDIELPKIFETRIREDIVQKCYEATKFVHPYSNDPEAGKKHSASGTISHKRHDWKGHYGKGISRAPRKTMWRRGTQFFWIGAEISGARGGRRAHPPKGIGVEKKINKKEIELGMNSALAATAKEEYILKRYAKLNKLDIRVPVIIESDLQNAKAKEILLILKNSLGNAWKVALKRKEVRKGRGKLRGRKYKSNSGILFVTGNDEVLRMKGFDIKKVREIEFADLYPLGRVTVYTENALKDLEARK